MNCNAAERQIFAERDGALDTTQRAALAEHLARCANCRGNRERLGAVIESWRTTTQNVAVPDSDREWQALRRQIRGGGGPVTARTSGRRIIPWLALPLGAAAALTLTFFNQPTPTPVAHKDVARADAVEVSAADGSVVFVDDKSGWVVIWEGEAGAKTI